MNRPRFLAVLLLILLVSGNAAAHRNHAHRHARIGVTIGLPPATWNYQAPGFYYPYGYSYRYSYPPAILLASPPVYIEQNAASPGTDEQTGYWWYYCQSAQGYYPYVTECPQGWQRVAPQPPDLR